jgi:hypothetical protein
VYINDIIPYFTGPNGFNREQEFEIWAEKQLLLTNFTIEADSIGKLKLLGVKKLNLKWKSDKKSLWKFIPNYYGDINISLWEMRLLLIYIFNGEELLSENLYGDQYNNITVPKLHESVESWTVIDKFSKMNYFYKPSNEEESKKYSILDALIFNNELFVLFNNLNFSPTNNVNDKIICNLIFLDFQEKNSIELKGISPEPLIISRNTNINNYWILKIINPSYQHNKEDKELIVKTIHIFKEKYLIEDENKILSIKYCIDTFGYYLEFEFQKLILAPKFLYNEGDIYYKFYNSIKNTYMYMEVFDEFDNSESNGSDMSESDSDDSSNSLILKSEMYIDVSETQNNKIST